MTDRIEPKNIVILGAGFGGLRAARELASKLRDLKLDGVYRLYLIDKNEHHTYTPLLYEAATTSKEIAGNIRLHSVIAYKLSELLADLPIAVIQDEVIHLDLIEGDIHFKSGRKIRYDYLLLALGAEVNYFNIPGLKEHSLPLKTFTDAIKIRDTLYQYATDNKPVRIVIGGGGSTGVELAGEIRGWCGEIQETYHACKISIKIIQGTPTILPGFSETLVKKAERRLKKLGIETIPNETIERAEENSLSLKSGTVIPFDVLLWTGGVKAPSFLGGMPIKKEPRERIEVADALECLPQTPDLRIHKKIFAVGDNICFYDPKTKKPIPGVARAAISQANVAAHNILEYIKCDSGLKTTPKLKIYKPMEYPYIIPVGGKYAIAKIGPFIISGFFAWLLKGFVELYYLLSIMPPKKAIRTWLKGFFIFVQNDRLG